MAVSESWTKKYLGEILGTFLLVFLGDSFVAYAQAGAGGNGFKAGLLGAGFFWGFAVMLAIYAAGAVSGAHLTPAGTLPRPWRRVSQGPRRRGTSARRSSGRSSQPSACPSCGTGSSSRSRLRTRSLAAAITAS